MTATTQNRITSGSAYTYDTAGNMTAITGTGGGTFTFNAENQMTQAATASTTGYVYDGDGKRVEKTSTGTPFKLYWYGMSGDPLDETDQTGVSTNGNFGEYIFFGGGRIARRDSANNVLYYAADHLGTSRVMALVPSGQTTVTLCYDADFYPFGGERSYTTTCSPSHKFTGKERDAESGLDHFQFRKFSSAMGRFMSPDPAGMMAVDIGSPQTLNRYSYVLNNPLSFTDPFGLDCAYLNSSGTGIVKGGIDQNSSSGECGKTGGYWVEGTITQVNIDSNATTISLTGTTNGTNQTNASYQQNTTVSVGLFENTFFNPAGHIAFGIGNGPRYGLNPRSDWQFMKYAISHRMSGHVGGGPGVPGAVKLQPGKPALEAHIPVTGMQAQMVQNGINQGIQNAPNYDVGGGTATCDCASWPQQILGDAGINTGAATQDPGTLINQIDNLYPQ